MSADTSVRGVPRVSVILPVYNGSATVREAVKSVLTQTLEDFELIVVNDASTDDTRTIIESFRDPRVKLLDLKLNAGRSEARNLGVGRAQAQYVAMIDADDVWLEKKLELQISFLDANPEVAMCGTWAYLRLPSGKRLEWRQPEHCDAIVKVMLRSSAFIHCTVVLRKIALEAIGGYDKGLEPAEDYDLYLRMASRYPVRNVPYFLAEYRAHDQLRYKVREQWAKVPVRWKAIASYHYPIKHLIYLVTPFLMILVPRRLKYYLMWRRSSVQGS